MHPCSLVVPDPGSRLADHGAEPLSWSFTAITQNHRSHHDHTRPAMVTHGSGPKTRTGSASTLTRPAPSLQVQVGGEMSSGPGRVPAGLQQRLAQARTATTKAANAARAAKDKSAAAARSARVASKAATSAVKVAKADQLTSASKAKLAIASEAKAAEAATVLQNQRLATGAAA